MTVFVPGEVVNAALQEQLRELDVREDADHKVELLWSPLTCTIYVRVTTKDGQQLVGVVPNAEARWAFDHPFMYV